MYDDNQIGLPGSQNLYKQMMAESGLEMQWIDVAMNVVGGIFGYSAGKSKDKAANKQTKINYEAAKDNWKYSNEQADRQVQHLREATEIQARNNVRNANWKDATNLKNWQLTVDEGDFKFANQLEAKLQSDQVLDQNLAYNRQATREALNQQDNWLLDRKHEKDFNFADQGIAIAEATTKSEAAYNSILTNAGKARQDVFDAMRNTQQQRNVNRMQISFKAQENMVSTLMEAGKAQNMQAGRSGDKAIQSAVAAGGRQEAQLEQQATDIYQTAAINMASLNTTLLYGNLDTSNKLAATNAEFQGTMDRIKLDSSKATESWLSAKRQDSLQRQDILLSKKQQDMNARAQNMLMPKRGPIPPPPFATPLPELQYPMDHVWSPKPRKGATVSGGGLAALSGHLTGIGTSLDNAFNKGD